MLSYECHTDNNSCLRYYERHVLVYLTASDGYNTILKCGYLKSWNVLKNEDVINEQNLIGLFLNNPTDYCNYIMFNNGDFSVELVISSKQKGFICMGKNAEYTAGARLYSDAINVV